MSISDIRARAGSTPEASEPSPAPVSGSSGTELAQVGAQPKPNHYCLHPAHAAQLVTRARFFYSDVTDGCPVCVCGRAVDAYQRPKQVSAVPIELDPHGDPILPPGMIEVAQRIGQEIE